MKSLLYFVLVQFFISPILLAQEEQKYYPDPSPIIHEQLEKWQDLKFGLLIHWGTYSQWGIVESWTLCPEDIPWATGERKKGESEDDYYAYKKNYENLKNTFNPTKFNAEKWAKAAHDSGMKYLIFTTKHHDGFCMFDTQYTDYKITDPACPYSVNPKSNVTKEVFDAFRKENLWVGAYFSKPDWHSDDYWWKNFPIADRNANYQISKYPEKWQSFVEFTHNQIGELMTQYGKVDILWLDGGWVRKTSEEEVKNYLLQQIDGVRYMRNPQNQDIKIEELAQKVRKLNPKVLIVDRACPGPYQNYMTPEQHIPDEGLSYPWETCMTMATSWSYKENDVYKSSEELIKKMVDVVSKGGNFLLNIAPDENGEWDAVAYSRLHDIGDWMNKYGKAIYNTRKYKQFGEGEKIRFTTTKDQKKIYVFVMDKTNEFSLESIPYSIIKKISVVGFPKTKARISLENGKTKVEIPKDIELENEYLYVLQLELN